MPTPIDYRFRAEAFRLKPGQDLFKEIRLFVESKHIEAGVLLSGVGSLTKAVIRYADQPTGATIERKMEIVSLNGTVSQHGCHVHLAVSLGDGQCLGGHLMDGCLVYTTAEIVIGILDDVRFLRQPCKDSGYNELVVERK